MWIGYLASADRSFFIFEKAHISGTFHHLFELLTVVYFGGIIGGVLYQRFDENRYHRRYCYGAVAFLFIGTSSFKEKGENR
jgi:hypothetical protein